MRLRPVLPVVVVSWLVLLALPGAAQGPSTPVFAGRAVIDAPAGGSAIDVTITKRLPLSPSLALAPSVMQVTGTQDMVLVVLRAQQTEVPDALPGQVVWGKTRSPDGGDVRVAPTGYNRDNRKEVFFGDRTLAPGKYRLYVVAAAPVRVRLSLPGATGAPVALAPRARTWSTLVDLPAPTVGGVPSPAAAVGSTQTLAAASLNFQFLVVDLSTELGEFDSGPCRYRGGPPAGKWLPTCPGSGPLLIGSTGVVSTSGRKAISWGVNAQLPRGVWGAGVHYEFAGTARSVHAYQAWLTY